MVRTLLCFLCFLAANAQETIQSEFSLPQEEWNGQRLAIWSNGFHIRHGERTHTSLRVFDRNGTLAFEVDLAKNILPDTTIDDVLRLDDGSLIAAVRTYDKEVESLLVFVNSQGQIASTQRVTPFRPMRLWLESSGQIVMIGRVSPSDDLTDSAPRTRELVLRTYESGGQSLRMLSSKATGLVLPVPTVLTSWEPRDIIPAGGHVVVLIERTPVPRFVEISVADGSVIGDWTIESPKIAVEGKSARLTLGEFTLTVSHRLIAFFGGERYFEERYFELDRANKQWVPVNALNRLSGSNNVYAADGERVLVFCTAPICTAPIGKLGFSWIPLEESTKSMVR
jgi:hypothetical protein